MGHGYISLLLSIPCYLAVSTLVASRHHTYVFRRSHSSHGSRHHNDRPRMPNRIEQMSVLIMVSAKWYAVSRVVKQTHVDRDKHEIRLTKIVITNTCINKRNHVVGNEASIHARRVELRTYATYRALRTWLHHLLELSKISGQLNACTSIDCWKAENLMIIRYIG